MASILKLVGGILTVAGVAVFVAAYATGSIFERSPSAAPPQRSMYEFTMKDIDGNDVKLDRYKGNVVMIVNTASKCGLTPQYKGLQSLYEKYKDRGFVVLGFPANNFMGQEPGSEKEIKEFCDLNYKVSFPMFSKISVKGEDQHPFYTFLTHKESDPQFAGDITWNFEKFIAGRDERLIARFSPKTTPDSAEVVKTIESALEQKTE